MTPVAAAVCKAGVALGNIDLRFAWQVWHLVFRSCVAGVALMGLAGSDGTPGSA